MEIMFVSCRHEATLCVVRMDLNRGLCTSVTKHFFLVNNKKLEGYLIRLPCASRPWTPSWTLGTAMALYGLERMRAVLGGGVKCLIRLPCARRRWTPS